MNRQISDTLSYIGDILNKEKITWIIGGSIILDYYGLTNIVNDIDIIVDIKDYKKVKELLSNLGTANEIPKNDIYKTEGYFKIKINDVDIDIMANFKIVQTNGIYEYNLDPKSVSTIIQINQTKIPLGSLEDWHEIYQAIPGRTEKASLIKEYLINKK